MKIHELFAYLHVKDAAKAIEFYTKAFGAKEKYRLAEPSGRIGHAELDFGGATLMLADEFPEYGLKGPTAYGATTVSLHLHVDDADEVIRRAVAAGGKIVFEPKDQFYGERSGRVRDPFGHEWNIGHHLADVSPDEMQRRYVELMKTDKEAC
jgi:PhnB protein